MPQTYPNQGPPLPPPSSVPATSNSLRPAPITPNQFGPPPTMGVPQFPSQPSFPNQPPSNLPGMPQYPGTQPPFNGPPSTFPSANQPPAPTGYPQQQLPSQYGSQSHLSGPSTMPNSQLNGPGTYPGQMPPAAPVQQQQQPYQPQRIDPDMVPNVVRIETRVHDENITVCLGSSS